MSSHEDVITLVMQRHDLAALQLRLWWEQRKEQARREQTEGRAEVIQDQLRVVVRGISVAGQLLALHPVCNAEVAGRARGQMDDGEAGGFLGVFLDDYKGRVVAVCGELGDFTYGELVAVTMGGARDVDGVGEESAEEVGFFVEIRVYGCGEKDLGRWWWLVGEQGWEFKGEALRGEVEVGACACG